MDHIKRIIIIVMLLVGVGVILYLNGCFVERIFMNGNKKEVIEINEAYHDPGISVIRMFNKNNISYQSEGKVDNKHCGSYRIRYEVAGKSFERIVEVVDKQKPDIKLNGEKEMVIFEGSKFEDPSVKVSDNSNDKLDLKIEKMAMDKPGNYQIKYIVSDLSGNSNEVFRIVRVVKDPTRLKLFYHHDQYDNKYEEWWFEKSKNNQRMKAARESDFLKQYDSYYLGKDEKVIYLTFDEGGNDITYIKEIAKVLDELDVDATFFVTRNYLLSEKDFMKQLVYNGHMIGNHTWHHYDMTALANASNVDKFVEELTQFEKSYVEIFRTEMVKVFRFPKGGFSERAMQMVKELGYRNYFWSHAYYDFAHDVSKQEALDTLLSHVHNGAIYLLHPSNKGNYEAIRDFVLTLQKQGYRFALVDEIGKTNKK